MRWLYLKVAVVFFICAWLLASALYLGMAAIFALFYGIPLHEVQVFAAFYRMFAYHWANPFQYITVVCAVYAFLAAAFAPLIATYRHGWLFNILVLLLAPVLAAPLGGMLWHLHDMLAGFFPVDAWGKVFRGIADGLVVGPLLLFYSFPYNVFCLAMGFWGTRTVARFFYEPQAL